jgi:hypothetical protein
MYNQINLLYHQQLIITRGYQKCLLQKNLVAFHLNKLEVLIVINLIFSMTNNHLLFKVIVQVSINFNLKELKLQ